METLGIGREMSKKDIILVVDDNSDNLVVTRKVLERGIPGVEIVTFQDPLKVMEFLETSDISAGILDMQMPGMTGIKLCSLIKTSEKTKHVPVILITSHDASSILKTQGLEGGADDFISRPINNIELIARVKVVLRITHAERALREKIDKTEDQYKMLFDKMLSGFATHEMIFDAKGKAVDYRFITVNSAFEKLTGLKKKDVIGKNVSQILPDLEASWIKRYNDVLKTGHPIHFEDYIASLDKYFEVTAFKINEKQFAVSFNDITKRIRMEEHLRRADKMDAIGHLAGGIAHDFNNILTGIFGNLLMAKKKIPKEHPAFQFLEESRKAMSRATSLTSQLLTFAEGGNPVKEDVSIEQLVKEIVTFDLSGSKVKPIFTVEKKLRTAKVDQGQMQQVFSNLAINADQAMPDGGKLYISLENTDVTKKLITELDQGEYLKCVIRDEGMGIGPKELGRIFDPYYTTKQTGSGLGLATVYSIINKHGGHISVDSELGKGTIFTLYLPVSNSTHVTKTKHVEIEKKSTKRMQGRILVMDDDAMICELVTAILKAADFTVETVPDGKKAIEMYKQSLKGGKPFDALIMDLTIPGGVGGKEAIKELLKINPEVKCIVSSGYSNDLTMSEYGGYGFKGIVAKPFSPDKLIAEINKVLVE